MKSNWIINSDNSIYHLGIRREQISPIIITVGDPSRVGMISAHFDTIEFIKSSREFVTHTGIYKNKRITVISTGIGTDNIDIVLHELDAVWNLNLQTGEPLPNFTPLTFIRIGTSGAIQNDIPIDSFLISEYAVGLDGLMHYYSFIPSKEHLIIDREFNDMGLSVLRPYLVKANHELIQIFSDPIIQMGVSLTAPGFYGPQGRSTRIKSNFPTLLDQYSKLSLGSLGRITNIEMETSALYGLSDIMNHRCISLNAILANRLTGTFSNHPEKTIEKLIQITLKKIAFALN